jgi:uncharacterized protein YbcI
MSRDCVTLSHCTPLPTTSIVVVALRFDKGGACFPFDSQKWMQSDCQLESIRAMKTRGELGAAISDGVSRFEQDYFGRGPQHIYAHLIGDLLVIRLQGILTSAEQHLVKALPAEKGRNLLKEVRTQLIETSRPALEILVQDVTDVKPLSLHHDISTLTGEEIMVFTLAEAPCYREAKKK